MRKKKTSKKLDYLFKNTKKLKQSSDIKSYNPAVSFSNPAKVLEALIECLKDGDAEAFKEILTAYLDITNKDTFAKSAGVSRRTLFRMLSEEGNPTLDNVAKVVSAISKAA